MGIRALVASTLLCCLVAGGCTGDPEPNIADPTPTPTSAAPTASDTADPQEPYRAFIADYVEAISESLSTGDPGPWLAMSDPACQNCPVFAQNVRDAYAGGGRIEGAKWELKAAAFHETTSVGEVWYAEVDNAAERWLDAEGGVVKLIDSSTNYLAFAITGTADDLTMRELRFRQP